MKFTNTIAQTNNTSLFDKSILEMDRIKQRGARIETNLYFDTKQLEELFLSENCQLYVQEDALLFLVPKHANLYYECYYFTSNLPSLTKAFTYLKQEFQEDKKIRIIIVGKDERTAPICEAFYDADCVLHRKLIRRRDLGQNKEQIKRIKAFLDGEEKQKVCFAKKSDIDEIYAMLIEEFDYYGDNIPEKKELLTSIRKKNIIIVRKDNKIAAFRIFLSSRNIYNFMFDLTRAEYRLDLLQLHIQVHLSKYLKRKKIKPTRCYEWRDVKKVKIIKGMKNISTYHETDVLYINFLLYPAIENNRIIAK